MLSKTQLPFAKEVMRIQTFRHFIQTFQTFRIYSSSKVQDYKCRLYKSNNTHRFQKLIYLHWPTDCFMKISLQSLGLHPNLWHSCRFDCCTPMEWQVVSVHLIPRQAMQSETKHGQIRHWHGTATEIRPPTGFEPNPNQHLLAGSRQQAGFLTTKPTRPRLPTKKQSLNIIHCFSISLYDIFGSSMIQGRSTMHPKFDLSGVRTHDLQIMTVHFMSLRLLL